jgi:hypothetical protein
MPAGTGGQFPWYAVIISERGVPTAHVLTALEWQHDQDPNNQGPFAAKFTLIGGYNTKAEAQAAVDKFNSEPNPKKLSDAGIPSAPDLPNPLTGINAVGDFFQRLTQPATWARVGEVVLGGILVYAGVRALSHGAVSSPAAKPVTKPAQKVATKAASIVVPEARLATRVAAKRAAPRTTARIAAHRSQVAQYGQKRPPVRKPVTPRPKARPIK